MYTNKQNMIDAYGERSLIELTDRADEPANVIDDAILDRAIEEAGYLADSYVGIRYNTVLARSAPVLREHVQAIAYYKLHRSNYPDEVRTAYEDSIAFLKGISSGIANLDIEGVQPASAPADARVDGPKRVFSRDSLRGL